jgi:O-antigen/teichoic acid export membrane protein
MVVPFLMRTAMIYIMGVQYLGLNSLFVSIIQVLSLAELGVGNAMVFAMYKPIAQDDEQMICALMRLYRKYYRIIGSIIGVVGLALTPLVPKLISSEVPEGMNIYILYLLNLATTVLTYWLFAYKNSLLQAHQRNDIVSWVTAGTYTVQWCLQLGVLLLYHNYYLYLVVALLTQVLNNVVSAVIVTRKYPKYKPAGKLSRETVKSINQKIRDLFTAKIGGVVLKSSDTIVLSAFLGLTPLAIYQNYFFIVSSVTAIIETVLASMMAGLGNSYVLESREKNYRDLRKFSFLFLWLTGMCTCCFLGMYQPFMEIWVGKELMLGMGEVMCFAGYFYVYVLNRLLNIYKDAAGLWHEDRFRPFITAVVNLGLNLLLVNVWGVYGVLLSTVISMVVVGMPWVIHNLFTHFFEKKMLKAYLLQVLTQTAAMAAAGALVCLICAQLHLAPIVQLICCGIISVILPNVLFFVLFYRSRQFRFSVQFADKITKGKLRLEKRIFRNPEKL